MKSDPRVANRPLYAVLLMSAVLLGGHVAPAYANCSPPCRNGTVCSYDSTRKPPSFCRKPRADQRAASTLLPAAAPTNPVQRGTAQQGPRRPPAQYNPKELQVDKRK